jgi:PAS domain S-box-containing protein
MTGDIFMEFQVPTPTNNEKVMHQEHFIVSKTDTKGYITYCNEIFMDMAGYNEEELLGANHNLIRHPDMPKVAFKLAWDIIQAKKEFFGFVKNLSRDGSFYWVFAHITADYDSNGNIIGYTSFRRKPSKAGVDALDGVYKLLVQEEQKGGMQTAANFLFDFLDKNNTTYDDLILSLQGS